MKTRKLGATGLDVSEISLGTWQLGGRWGEPFDARRARETLEAAWACGVRSFDTADIYQSGESERAIGAFLAEQSEPAVVVTKVGRRIDPHVAEGYTPETIREHVLASIERLRADALDCVLLHCPPGAVYENDALWDALRELRGEGLVRHFGASVETVAEAGRAMDQGAEVLEIIYNMFRQKPERTVFERARRQGVGILARVPLASGLLTGKFTASSVFSPDDHRAYNRDGAFFDKGETFSGVDYEAGLAAVDALRSRLGREEPLALLALRWILMSDAVSTVIPGASSPEQMRQNAQAADLPALSDAEMAVVRGVYDEFIRASVEPRW